MSRPDSREPLPFRSRVPRQDVEVRVSATADSAVTIRTVAADLALRAEYTLDAVADLRLAVDEACAALVGMARPDTRLACAFVVDSEHITVTASVSTTGPTALPTDTLAWKVLTTLTDDLRVLAEAPARHGDPHRLAVRLSVPRAGTAAA